MEAQNPPPCLCVITGTTAINLGSIPLRLPSWQHLPPGHPSACPFVPPALLQIRLCFPQGTEKRKHSRKHDSSQQFVHPTVCDLLHGPLAISFPFHIYLFPWDLLEKTKGEWRNHYCRASSASLVLLLCCLGEKFASMSSVPFCEWMKVLVCQSCLTLCDPTDCSPPGSSVHGILQARILEWVAISFSRQEYWSGYHSLLQGIFPI